MTDRELLARIAASAGPKGRIQAVGPRAFAPRRPRAPSSPRATGPPYRPRPAHSTRPRPLEPFPARPSRETTSSPAASICTATATALSAPIANPPPADSKVASTVQDIFIPPNEINAAMQGDQVLVELDPPKADGRQQGRIVRILERRNPTVVGTFRYGAPRSRPQQCCHSLRRPHDAAHRDSTRRGNPARRWTLQRRIASWVTKQTAQSKTRKRGGPGRPRRRCRDHQLAHAHAPSHRPRH